MGRWAPLGIRRLEKALVRGAVPEAVLRSPLSGDPSWRTSFERVLVAGVTSKAHLHCGSLQIVT